MEENNLLYFLKKSTSFLEKKNIPNPRLEAEILISYILDFSRIQLYAKFDRPLSDIEKDSYRELILKRSQNVPTAYLVGKKNFYGSDFVVNDHVLIPRPETEEMVEYALKKLLKDIDSPRVLDLCCGSGCIGITIQKEKNTATVDFIDISELALNVTKENYKSILNRNAIDITTQSQDTESSFIHTDLLRDLPRDNKYDLIITNPPYVLPSEELSLSAEVLHEPRIALVVEDFANFHKQLLEQAIEHITTNGKILVETNPLMMDELVSIAKEIGLSTEIILDLSKKERFLLAWK